MQPKGYLFLVLSLMFSTSVHSESTGQNQSLTDLGKAIKQHDSAALISLLKKGVDPNSEIDGWPGIVLAAKLDQTQLVQLFLAKGAGVNALNVFGDTALIVASYRENVELVRLLLDAEADPKTRGHRSRTALWHAAEKGNTSIAKLLLDNGAEVESGDTETQETPLLSASSRGHDAMVKLLITYDANVNATNRECESGLQLASRYDNTVVLLREYGAKLEPYCFTKVQIFARVRQTLLAVFYLASLTALPYFLFTKASSTRQLRMRGWVCLFFLTIGTLGWMLLLGIPEFFGLVKSTAPDDWIYLLALFPPLLVVFLIWTVLALGFFYLLVVRYVARDTDDNS